MEPGLGKAALLIWAAVRPWTPVLPFLAVRQIAIEEIESQLPIGHFLQLQDLGCLFRHLLRRVPWGPQELRQGSSKLCGGRRPCRNRKAPPKAEAAVRLKLQRLTQRGSEAALLHKPRQAVERTWQLSQLSLKPRI